MRRLFIPACLCLATWSGAVGPETPWPLETAASSTHAESKTKAEKEPAERGPAATTGSTPTESPAPAPAITEKKPDDTPGQAEHTASVMPEPAPIPNPVPEPPRKPVVHRSQREICDTLAKAAHSNNLPVPFFIRLLFQESRFEAGVVSHAGAQGIAQFMPETAASVGLDNPFDPLQAIPAAARLLRDLADQFGNLGLAAAAYNAGPDRVHKWLNKQSVLPAETLGYVKTITGQAAESWKITKLAHSSSRLPGRVPCKDVSGLYAFNGTTRIPLPPKVPALARIKQTVPEVKTAHAATKTKTPPKHAEQVASADPHAKHGKAVASAEAHPHHGKKTALQLAARKREKRARH